MKQYALLSFKVGEIHFKNSYTAFITVKAKFKAQAENGDAGGKSHFSIIPQPLFRNLANCKKSKDISEILLTSSVFSLNCPVKL